MSEPPFPYAPVPERRVPPLPGGARVAVWFGLNVEHYRWGRPALSLAPFTAELVPDPLNYGWRDYGARAGVFRLARIFAALDVPVTAVTNVAVMDEYPQIVATGLEHGWTWAAHGADNSTWQTFFAEDDERAYIADCAARLEAATGTRPRGWLGPALTASERTHHLLAEAGFAYTLDWANDDLPYELTVRRGSLLSVPYASELNDIPLCHLRGFTAEQFAAAVVDQVEQLAEEGADQPRVTGIGLHPFLAGQPWRARHLARALERVRDMDGVWLTTADAVADWYAAGSVTPAATGAGPA